MLKTKLEITHWLNQMEINNFTINEDLTIDVDSDVYLYNKKLTNLPVQFRNINGLFTCANNKLQNLKGSPENVLGYFDCSNNNLSTLKNSPIKVHGDFIAGNNPLVNIEGISQYIDGNMILEDTLLRNLALNFLPKYVKEKCIFSHRRDEKIYLFENLYKHILIIKLSDMKSILEKIVLEKEIKKISVLNNKLKLKL